MPQPRTARLLACLLLAPILLVACEDPRPDGGDGASTDPAVPTLGGDDVVLATQRPLRDLAAAIATEAVAVRTLLPAEADPLTWRPDRDAALALQRAGLIVLNGAGLEPWRDVVALPESRTVDASSGLASELLELEGTVTHSHGPAGAHSHAGTNPHVWLDPVLARGQALAIREAMIARWPQHEEAFRAGFESLARRLAAIDARWRALAPRLAGRAVLAPPATYDYLAHRHGFTILEAPDAGDPPPPPDGEGPHLAFVTTALDAAARDALLAAGWTAVHIDPGLRPDAGTDLPAVMEASLDRLEAALGTG